MKGRVFGSTGIVFAVMDLQTGEFVECRIRGKLRLKGVRSTSPVVVGDIVEYETDDMGESFVTEVCQRSNYIIRRSPNLSKESHIIATNIDQAMIVVTLFSPPTNVEFIDRFLVCCEAYNVPAIIVLNKIDLAQEQPELLNEFRDIYALAGYRVLEVSATDGTGVEQFKELIAGKTTLISGNSGVGKSTLIGTVVSGTVIKTGEISQSHSKGKHTTTFSTMYLTDNGGYVIDTPGIKGFGLIDISPEEVCRYFPELLEHSKECQFYNCTHTHEPKCAVMAAVEQGKIAVSRYESYLKITQDDEKYRK